ncbi:MAG: hypothetical protein ACW990_15000 [Promethearchaeota archaeon]|jgi:hypothetical protein
MGQQQILLLVLALIIVGGAIVIGMELFSSNVVLANRDSIIAELNNMAAVSLQYYKKPRMMGRGSRSFTNWKIPAGLDSTAYGRYVASPTVSVLTITATGTEIGDDGVNFVKIVATVTPANISMAIQN